MHGSGEAIVDRQRGTLLDVAIGAAVESQMPATFEPVTGDGPKAVLGRNLSRDRRLPLLRGLPEVPPRDPSVAVTVLGAPDLGREVPHHAAGSSNSQLRLEIAHHDQGAAVHVAPPPEDVRSAMAACRRGGPPRAVGRSAAGAGTKRGPEHRQADSRASRRLFHHLPGQAGYRAD